jgi:hypothetical protein
MFEFIREKKKLLLILLLLLVIPPFVVVGAWDRINPASGTVVASVNGKDLYQREWEVAHQQLIDDFKQRIGQDVPEEVFNSQSAKEITLDDMIDREILQVITQEMSIYVPNTAVKSVISSIPQFQTNGEFDLEKAQDFLSKRGTRSDLFEAGVRNDLALRAIPSAISETAFVPRSVARKIAQAENEGRKIRVKFFSSLSYEKDSSISKEEVENFYAEKKDMFQIPPRYDLEFILVNESDQLEEIANSVYEESESLNPTANSFDLKIRNANGLNFSQRLIDPSLSNDELNALNNPKFRAALRNVEVMEEGNNTDLLEINSKLHISARIVKKYDSKPIQFEVVKPQIESELKLKKMATSANKVANEWLESYNSSSQDKKLELLTKLSKPIVINRSNPNSNLGKYSNALTGKTDQIFDYKFRVNDLKTLDLGRNGSLIVFLESSQIPKPSSSSVIDSLPEIYANLNNVESQIALKSWLNQAQLDMSIERYSDRLGSSSSTE